MKFMRGYIRGIDAMNRRIGRIMMYGIFVLMGVLLWSTVSKAFFVPSLWTLEMAQFIMVGYYILGGPYSIQLGSNVRMDLLYGDWSLRRKAWFDLFTVFFLIFYLCVLLYGAVSSTAYSLGYWGTEPFSFFGGLVTGTEEIGHMEKSSSAWRPYLWPIKVVMIVGIFLMLLQCLSELLKDVLRLKGEAI
ncbi:C4-dicarboxylate ABC transporter [Sulfitobacter sp. HI0082]|jgi:TRAP-type mannitol/chloroaromatic compound transport system permease small subunit|uniref:TRAP transporter small permease subunit n=1 Tax=Sulfitobacter sp. D7 TaxID=1968541 RepID=UPI0007CF0A30|nr:TRAP transporter small permease subunit [Sulfitobacter sp. D7]AYE84756.1 C4-dicarboxylate ABC transporter [Sulfitobacter sp. D7]KZZ23574.1 C4-dicarboxylate ABC transporter [Sulfitobacter sp. HI0082]KZZ24770.1 C4-dicarboxylate ABC transporter [Sulfitobacter sp. HI0082]HAC48580.1 C4-dicarboxylate ABC transporter [Sulfitobacter sp.]|tara:strand:+ start:688 stop:1254 length:567 start_codon:yes stop_codon:yes gene_type:complete